MLMAVGLLAMAACSTASKNGQPVADRLAAAKRSFDNARFIGFMLSSDNLPGGTAALESAHGTGTHAPAFTGSVQVMKGLSIDAGLVAVDGAVYAKLPFVGWSKINPADYGAPDPAALMNRRTGISSLLTDTVGARSSGSERSGSTILTKVDGTLPGKDVHALFSSAALSRFKVTFTLTDGNALHGVSITGPFYGDHGDCTYSIVFDLRAAPVTITAPQ